MASDKITMVISAKDLASKTLGNVKASTIALGTAAGTLLADGFKLAANSMRGWINEALESEKANVMLDAALRGTGQYSVELSRRYKDLANAIQDETGATDESVKANIAQLTTLGVSSDAMDGAARAVQSLASLGRDGALAMVAVAKAAEGDISAFERFSPEVKMATTVQEKFAAAARLVNAGYEQQKASLDTVGGSWAALMGRIGDAREEIAGSIMDGLGLADTFKQMQGALGAFLKSDTFVAFTEKLRQGAEFAKDTLKALATPGKFQETAHNIGDLLLAALLDGGDYIADKIESAISKSTIGEGAKAVGNFMGLGRFTAVARGADALMSGLGVGEAMKEIARPEPENTGGAFDRTLAATAKLLASNAAIIEDETSKMASASEQAAQDMRDMADSQAESERSERLFADGKRKALEIEKQKADIEKVRADALKETASIEEEIKTLADREKTAKDEATKAAEQLARLEKEGVAAWIANKGEEDANNKRQQTADAEANNRRAKIEGKLKRGIGLSNADEEFLRKSKARDKELADLQQKKQEQEQAAIDAATVKRVAEEELQKTQDQMLAELKALNKKLPETFEVG